MNSHEYVLKLAKSAKPEMRYDFIEDFSVWKKRASAKLCELLGLPLEKPDDDKFEITEQYLKDGLEFIHFSFQSEEGYIVPCCLVKNVKYKTKRHLAICLQGHSTGMHISLGEIKFETDAGSIAGGRDFAIRAAKEGMIAIAIEQRYMGTNGSNNGEPSCVPNNDFTYSNQAMASLLIGRTAIGERVWDVQRLIDIAQKHFSQWIDFSELVCLGNSGGGTITFYAACLDERITVAVPSCSVCTYEDSIMAMNHCPCNFIPNIRKYFDMGDLCALSLPGKMLIVCGKEDPIFPLAGVRYSFDLASRVYAHVKKPGNIRLVVGNEGHKFYPDCAWPVIHMLVNN